MGKIQLTRSEKLRLSVGILLLAMVAATGLDESPAKEKAPVLTLMAGAVILTGIFPIRRPSREELPAVIGTIIGTIIAIFGALFWLYDATEGQLFEKLATLFFGATALLMLFFMTAAVVWGASAAGGQGDPDMTRRRSIMRRVGRELERTYDRTTSEHGSPYSQYNGDISTIFLYCWSMVKNASRWTYNPREHQNLIENYLIEWLRYVEQLAIARHPSQCKYAEVAYNLAQESRNYLRTVLLITEFDPLPQECPECREALPAHKANCMAAICYMCKLPAPPQRRSSENTAVITPQCYNNPFCIFRGQQLNPKAPIVPRISLGFGIPEGSQDMRVRASILPARKKERRNTLANLQQMEDQLTGFKQA